MALLDQIPAAARAELKGSWRLLVMGRDRLRAVDDGYGMRLAQQRAIIQTTLSPADEELDELPGLRAREPRAMRLERLLSLSDELKVANALCHSLRAIHRRGKAGWRDGMPAEPGKWRSTEDRA